MKDKGSLKYYLELGRNYDKQKGILKIHKTLIETF